MVAVSRQAGGVPAEQTGSIGAAVIQINGKNVSIADLKMLLGMGTEKPLASLAAAPSSVAPVHASGDAPVACAASAAPMNSNTHPKEYADFKRRCASNQFPQMSLASKGGKATKLDAFSTFIKNNCDANVTEVLPPCT